MTNIEPLSISGEAGETQLVPSGSRTPAVPGLPSPAKVAEDLADKATPEQIATVIALLEEARRRGLTNYEAIGKLIKRDGTTISRVMRGKYEADLQPLCEHIRGFLDDCAEGVAEEPYLTELQVVKDIVPFCDLVRKVHQIGIIWGENQSGKTKALEYYAREHADVIYARLPAGGSAKRSLRVIATACGIPEGNSDVQLRDRILKRITPWTLLIVDEFHQAVNGRTLKMDTIERIREIHDLQGCGVVLCGTHVVHEMMEDQRYKRFLGQTDNRGAFRMNIPKAPTAKDRELLIAAYKLPRPDAATAAAVKKICDENGIARLTDIFQAARLLTKGETFGWQHVDKTLKTLKAWALGIRGEDEK